MHYVQAENTIKIKDNTFLNILHLNKTDRLSEIHFSFKKQFVLDIFFNSDVIFLVTDTEMVVYHTISKLSSK